MMIAYTYLCVGASPHTIHALGSVSKNCFIALGTRKQIKKEALSTTHLQRENRANVINAKRKWRVERRNINYQEDCNYENGL